ncbi:hypothetical protein J6590_080263 [Homalodisca vitripennis]|nr:hypothetical protein J6590_080263 [Homalodisca vitripennis]
MASDGVLSSAESAVTSGVLPVDVVGGCLLKPVADGVDAVTRGELEVDDVVVGMLETVVNGVEAVLNVELRVDSDKSGLPRLVDDGNVVQPKNGYDSTSKYELSFHGLRRDACRDREICLNVCLQTGRVQNMCVRYVCGLRRFDHVSEARRSLGLLTVADTCTLRSSCLVYRILTTGRPGNLREKLKSRSQVRSRSSRQDQVLEMPRVRREFETKDTKRARDECMAQIRRRSKIARSQFRVSPRIAERSRKGRLLWVRSAGRRQKKSYQLGSFGPLFGSVRFTRRCKSLHTQLPLWTPIYLQRGCHSARRYTYNEVTTLDTHILTTRLPLWTLIYLQRGCHYGRPYTYNEVATLDADILTTRFPLCTPIYLQRGCHSGRRYTHNEVSTLHADILTRGFTLTPYTQRVAILHADILTTRLPLMPIYLQRGCHSGRRYTYNEVATLTPIYSRGCHSGRRYTHEVATLTDILTTRLPLCMPIYLQRVATLHADILTTRLPPDPYTHAGRPYTYNEFATLDADILTRLPLWTPIYLQRSCHSGRRYTHNEVATLHADILTTRFPLCTPIYLKRGCHPGRRHIYNEVATLHADILKRRLPRRVSNVNSCITIRKCKSVHPLDMIPCEIHKVVLFWAEGTCELRFNMIFFGSNRFLLRFFGMLTLALGTHMCFSRGMNFLFDRVGRSPLSILHRFSIGVVLKYLKHLEDSVIWEVTVNQRQLRDPTWSLLTHGSDISAMLIIEILMADTALQFSQTTVRH